MFKIQQREQIETITRAGLCLGSKELKIASKKESSNEKLGLMHLHALIGFHREENINCSNA